MQISSISVIKTTKNISTYREMRSPMPSASSKILNIILNTRKYTPNNGMRTRVDLANLLKYINQ
jgi:hypothetical protein